MPAELDPVSQLVGALSAQINGLSAGLIDLRSEIITNRTRTENRWDDLQKQMDRIYAEYRTVKHLERAMETSSVAIDERLKSLAFKLEKIDEDTNKRLRVLENQVLEWKAKLAAVVAVAVILGTALSWILQAAIRKVVG